MRNLRIYFGLFFIGFIGLTKRFMGFTLMGFSSEINIILLKTREDTVLYSLKTVKKTCSSSNYTSFILALIACYKLYQKTHSTSGITCLVETGSTTRQGAIWSVVSLSTCYKGIENTCHLKMTLKYNCSLQCKFVKTLMNF